MKSQYGKLDQFFEFVFGADDATPGELRRDLESSGVDISRVERGITQLIGMDKGTGKLDWLDRARARQAEFERRLQKKREDLEGRFGDRQALLAAVLRGDLGNVAQTQAQVFFRNHKATELSDNDLLSLIEDCELLEDE